MLGQFNRAIVLYLPRFRNYVFKFFVIGSSPNLDNFGTLSCC